MVKTSVLALLALAACVAAEPPSGYSYSHPAPILVLGGGGGHADFSGGIGLGSGGSYRAVPHGYQTSEGQYVDPHLLEEVKKILLKDEIHNQQFQSSHSSIGLSGHYGAPSPVYGVPHYQERVVGIELGHVKQGIQVAQYEQDHGGYAQGGGLSLGGGYALGGGYSLGGGHSFGGGISLGGGGHGLSLGGGGHGLSLGGGGGHGLSLGGGGGHGLSLGGGGGHGISLSSGHSGPGYTTIAIPAGSYGVPVPSSRYGSPHH